MTIKGTRTHHFRAWHHARVDFAARSVGSNDDRLRLIVIRETLELTRAFFISQDGSSSIDC